MTPLIVTFAQTNTGRVRKENEDSVGLFIHNDLPVIERKGILAVVADGVGGAAAGKTASELTVRAFRDAYFSDTGELSLSDCIASANRNVREKAAHDSSYSGMASTCVALKLKEREASIANIGDSRAYLLRNGNLLQITEDHTLVGRMVRERIISEEEALRHPQRNVITKAIGVEDSADPDTFRVDVEKGDIFLLCSDGLYGMVPPNIIAEILTSYPLQEAGEELIRRANENGGTDNITVAILAPGVSEESGSSPSSVTRRFTVSDSPAVKPGRRITFVVAVLAVLSALAAAGYFLLADHGKKAEPDFDRLMTIEKPS